MPKPFIPLIGDRPLFGETLDRCDDETYFGPPIVVAGGVHVPLVEEQMSGSDVRLIVEPEAKNTAAAIALAACRLPEDAVMLVCPSDHHIGDRAAFVDAACKAAKLAGEGWLVAFGIAATAPETGFGYIKRGAPINDEGFRIERFVEKPDRATAEAFLADGGYAWNGGLFAFRAGTFMDELASHRPELAAAAREAVERGHEDGHRFHPDAESFARIKGESVDYAVMENTMAAAMVPADMQWSDIGNWQALRDVLERDEAGNVARGDAELVDCRNVMVDSDGPRVSIIGLEDVIVVVDKGEVLVTTADGAQKVGKLFGAVNQHEKAR